MTRLIIQRKSVADKIPNTFCEKAANRNIAIDPLTLISVIAIVGIIEIDINITMINTIA